MSRSIQLDRAESKAGVCGKGVLLKLAVLLLASFAGCSPSNSNPDVIRLQLNWYPDAQFGGFFAAKIHGDYEAEGIEVQIVSGGPDVSVIPKLVMGRVEFGVGNADQVLLARKEGADVVAVMASMQNCPRCIMVHRSSGIEDFEALQNVTLAIGEGNPFAQFMRHHLPLSGVRTVAYSGTVAKFLLDQEYAQQGYVFSEPIVARRKGADPVVLMVSDLGFNPYTGIVMTQHDTVQKNPELVRKFVRATTRGWRRYLDSPEAANKAMQEMHPEMNADILNESVPIVRELCLPDGFDSARLGIMTAERWVTLRNQMTELSLIPQEMEVDRAFTLEFLPSD